ncbi:hypothetical protein ACXPWS_19615 [Mycobacterium sp. BMJ-28]
MVPVLLAAALVMPAQASAESTGPPPPAPAPGELIRSQVDFHLDLAVDFIVTGAALTGRILPVPATLFREVGTGTPAPVALRHALVTLADVEFDAGRRLVGYARDYAAFQVQFVTGLLSALPGRLGDLVVAAGAAATAFVQRAADVAVQVVDVAQTALHRALGAPTATSLPRSTVAHPGGTSARAALDGPRPVHQAPALRRPKPHVGKHDSAGTAHAQAAGPGREHRRGPSPKNAKGVVAATP